MRASVDLPHPDSPTTPSTSPRRRERLTPSTADTCPRRRMDPTEYRRTSALASRTDALTEHHPQHEQASRPPDDKQPPDQFARVDLSYAPPGTKRRRRSLG